MDKRRSNDLVYDIAKGLIREDKSREIWNWKISFNSSSTSKNKIWICNSVSPQIPQTVLTNNVMIMNLKESKYLYFKPFWGALWKHLGTSTFLINQPDQIYYYKMRHSDCLIVRCTLEFNGLIDCKL